MSVLQYATLHPGERDHWSHASPRTHEHHPAPDHGANDFAVFAVAAAGGFGAPPVLTVPYLLASPALPLGR